MDHINRLKMLPYIELIYKIGQLIDQKAKVGATFVDFSIERHLNVENALDKIKKEYPYLKITDMGENPLCQKIFRASWNEAISSKAEEPLLPMNMPLPTAPQLPIQNMSPPISHQTDNIITFGKYNGKPYEFVKQSDVSYCNWILKQMSVSGKMLQFQQWLKNNSKKVTCECCNGSGLVDAI